MLPKQAELELAFSALEEIQVDWERALQIDRRDPTGRQFDDREILTRRLEIAVGRFVAVSADLLADESSVAGEPCFVSVRRPRQIALPAD